MLLKLVRSKRGRKAEATRLVEELSDLLDGDWYSADKIKSLNDAKVCEDMSKEIGEKFAKIDELNKELGGDGVDIADINEKYNTAVESINDRKGEIAKPQEEELEEENEEMREDAPADLEKSEQEEHEEAVVE